MLGVFRSGTSVVCAMLSRLGVDFGPTATMLRPAPENPLGYFQHRQVRDVNDRFILSAGADRALPDHPRDLTKRGDLAIVREVDLSWRAPDRPWGFKDPRLCATLLAFVEAGLLDPRRVRLVHVTRGRDATIRSGMKFHMVRNRANGSEDVLRQMLEVYERYARWHIEELHAPTLEVEYERLVRDPGAVAAEMAAFVGASDRRAIRQARSQVGVRKALLRYRCRVALARCRDALVRVVVRGPRKAWRILRRAVPGAG